MKLLKSRDVLSVAAERISDLLRAIDGGQNDGPTFSRLERSVRLWSECQAEPDMTVAWLDSPDDAIPAGVDAVVSESSLQPDVPSGVRFYPLGADAIGTAETPVFDQLPPKDAALRLFDGDCFRPEIHKAGIEALRANPTACVLMAGGAATRYADSVIALKKGLDDGAITPDQERTLADFAAAGMDPRACMRETKLFAPLGCVTGKSAFQINLESIAELSALSGRDVPVIVFVSEGTRAGVEKIIRENAGFGLRRIVVADQDNAPVIREDTYAQIGSANGPQHGANGGGGIVYSLGHVKPVDVDGRVLDSRSIIDWLRGEGVRRVIFSQTDDCKSVELYIGLEAAASQAGEAAYVTAASTSLYPTGLINGDPLTPAFKLGSYWSDGGSGTRCTEFAELTDAQKAMLSDPANRGRALANTALYLFDLDLLRRVIEQNSLKLHLQRHKKVQDQSGALVPCTKFEYFLPDLPELTGRYGGTCRLMLLRDTSGLSEPLRDLTVDALPAKDIGKLALSQRAKLYCDRQKCVEAGLAVEDGALVEIGPFARISAEEGAVIRSGARIYIGGTSDAPVHAVFKKSADLRGEMRITQSCEIR